MTIKPITTTNISTNPMLIVNPEIVDNTLNDLLQPEDQVLQHVRATCADKGLPAIEVSAQQGKMLELLVRTAKAQNILEIGTLGGYSTICLARGGGAESFVTTLEYEEHHAKVAHENLRYAGVHHRVGILVGDAHTTLAALSVSADPAYDFIFIDADKESNLDYTKWALALGTEDVTILVDNVIRDGRVIDPKRPDKLEFIKFLGEHPELDVSVVQTVGSKGWDGFVLAKRKRV